MKINKYKVYLANGNTCNFKATYYSHVNNYIYFYIVTGIGNDIQVAELRENRVDLILKEVEY